MVDRRALFLLFQSSTLLWLTRKLLDMFPHLLARAFLSRYLQFKSQSNRHSDKKHQKTIPTVKNISEIRSVKLPLQEIASGQKAQN